MKDINLISPIDGSVLIRDARYYDPRARGRFTVSLPAARCETQP